MHRMIALFCAARTAGCRRSPPRRRRPSRPPAPDPWIARTTTVPFQPFRAVDAPLQLDVPKKDWMVLPSSGCMVLSLANRRGDAVVLVERSTLAVALDASAITNVFAEIEISTIKESHPKATDFQSKILDLGPRTAGGGAGPRPGVLGTERVRQYALPIGKQLYHLIVISGAAQFAAYDPVFSHIAASFTVAE